MSSEYERNVGQLLLEKKALMAELEKDPKANRIKIAALRIELDALESMYENYNLGLNVFRRAQGGRSSLRE